MLMPIGKVFKCGLHCDANSQDVERDNMISCSDVFITKRSIYGANIRACDKGWNGTVKTKKGEIAIPSWLWPETILIEENYCEV